MRTWDEGALALVVLVGLGVALFLFTGEPLTIGSTDTTVPISFDLEAAGRGETVANETGCLACHTVDGTPGSGPTWKGLAGSSRPLESGEVVTADDTYLLNSIIDPKLEIVIGFDPIMPEGYDQQLSSEEINDLVEYLKSLAA